MIEGKSVCKDNLLCLIAGVIKTAESLDRERYPHHWLTVLATDLGVIPLVTSTEVFIKIMDVNDNPPQTTEPVYYTSIIENSPIDMSVLRIEADDPDSSSQGQLTFRINSENPRGFFAIDPKTGMLILAGSFCICLSSSLFLRLGIYCSVQNYLK